MNKLLILSVILFGGIIFLSCDEETSLMADFKTQYSINCVLSGMSDTQYVTVMKTFNPDELDTNIDITSLFVNNAEVLLRYKNEAYLLEKATRNQPGIGNVVYYFKAGLKPDFGEVVKIEVLLMSGKRLKSETTIPDQFHYNLQELEHNDPARSIPGNYNEEIKLTWNSNRTNIYYLPKIYIVYYKNDGLRDVRYEYEAPINYSAEGDNYTPIYASPSQGSGLAFSLSVFNRAMRLLSGDDPVKSNYRIYYANIEVVIFDENLSAYYASTGLEPDEYSVGLQSQNYTNIENGLGIFGSYIMQPIGMAIEGDFIRSFGYIPYIVVE